MITTADTGKYAEDLAFSYLKQQGMKPVARNFTSRYGEIDLVMQDRDCLVFVEVRYRKHFRLVDGASTVDAKKQVKLIRTAQYYLQKNRIDVDTSARFDIISITHKQNLPAIEWFKNAFTA
jgi:putative endonuclease